MAKPRPKKNRSPEPYQLAWQDLQGHPVFSPLTARTHLRPHTAEHCPIPKGHHHRISSNGVLELRLYRSPLNDAQWRYVMAHALLHLGFGHLEAEHAGRQAAAWNAACDVAVYRFLATLKVGVNVDALEIDPDLLRSLPADERGAYNELLSRGTDTHSSLDLLFEPAPKWSRIKPGYWQDRFAAGLRQAVKEAIDWASDTHAAARQSTRGDRALQAVMNRWPLMGALAAGFRVVEDAEICARAGIEIAAVSARDHEIYLNPRVGLNDDELLFVMAHEVLHPGLRHHLRCGDRDPYLWNVACDYVINRWLIEMEVGSPPPIGMLHDPKFDSHSAEEIYDIIAKDLRRARKLRGLRGQGAGDMLDDPGAEDWWKRGEGLRLDDFYRRALADGLEYHQSSGRGLLPADLVEEIRALSQPPIPWDVQLAEWFQTQFPPPQTRRTYGRPSRRQQATPDIPRPRTVLAPDALDGRVFACLVDTSGSMDQRLLGMALGAISSYGVAHEVDAVRVIWCDAQAVDAGWKRPEDLLGEVKVTGRGGTVLQPGVDLLESMKDCPKDAPLLIITDGWIEPDLRVRSGREHAFLIPKWSRLPFSPKGEVFHLADD